MGERTDAGNVIDVMGIYVPILVAKRVLDQQIRQQLPDSKPWYSDFS